jgi:hypothetical protein
VQDQRHPAVADGGGAGEPEEVLHTRRDPRRLIELVVDRRAAAPVWERIALPAAGGLLVGGVMLIAARVREGAGVGFVMEAIVLGRVRVPLTRSVLLALGSWLAIASGASLGREGPLIQFGAAAGEGTHRAFALDNVTARIVIAAGVAAGFASAYNAPVAAVLFVIEIVTGVVVLEAIVPMLIAVVIATIATRYVIGGAPLYGERSFGFGSPARLGLHRGAVAPRPALAAHARGPPRDREPAALRRRRVSRCRTSPTRPICTTSVTMPSRSKRRMVRCAPTSRPWRSRSATSSRAATVSGRATSNATTVTTPASISGVAVCPASGRNPDTRVRPPDTVRRKPTDLQRPYAGLQCAPRRCVVATIKSCTLIGEVAVAGGHNLLLAGPPNTGKTMVARRIPTLLPDMTRDEALETTKIYSALGLASGFIDIERISRRAHAARGLRLVFACLVRSAWTFARDGFSSKRWISTASSASSSQRGTTRAVRGMTAITSSGPMAPSSSPSLLMDRSIRPCSYCAMPFRLLAPAAAAASANDIPRKSRCRRNSNAINRGVSGDVTYNVASPSSVTSTENPSASPTSDAWARIVDASAWRAAGRVLPWAYTPRASSIAE